MLAILKLSATTVATIWGTATLVLAQVGNLDVDVTQAVATVGAIGGGYAMIRVAVAAMQNVRHEQDEWQRLRDDRDRERALRMKAETKVADQSMTIADLRAELYQKYGGEPPAEGNQQ